MRSAASDRIQYSAVTRIVPESTGYAGCPEHRSALDHRAPGFRKGGDAELHAARDRPAVPRRMRPAAILFPDAHPREIVAVSTRIRTPAAFAVRRRQKTRALRRDSSGARVYAPDFSLAEYICRSARPPSDAGA